MKFNIITKTTLGALILAGFFSEVEGVVSSGDGHIDVLEESSEKSEKDITVSDNNKEKSKEEAYEYDSLVEDPQGRTVVREKPYGARQSGDIIMIDQERKLSDQMKVRISQKFDEIAMKRPDRTREGLRVSIVWTTEIVREGVRAVAAGRNPNDLRQGIEMAIGGFVGEIKRQSRPVRTRIEIESVATTFSKDPEIGIIIADAIERAGENGIIKVEIEHITLNADREKLQERLVELADGGAIIWVRGTQEAEIKERKDRIESALSATRAAVEEGIVPGDSFSLLPSEKVLSRLKPQNADQQVGIDIVGRALQESFHQRISNKDIWYFGASKLKSQTDPNLGYDVGRNPYENKWNFGEAVVPTKIVRTAFQDAAFVAGGLITTEDGVLPPDQKYPIGGMDGGGGKN